MFQLSKYTSHFVPCQVLISSGALAKCNLRPTRLNGTQVVKRLGVMALVNARRSLPGSGPRQRVRRDSRPRERAAGKYDGEALVQLCDPGLAEAVSEMVAQDSKVESSGQGRKVKLQ